jgi:hypothetical protein
VIGTIGRLVLFRLAGEAFRSQLETVLGWVQRYQLWLVAFSFLLVAIQVFRKGGVETPEELAEEIESEESTPGDG